MAQPSRHLTAAGALTRYRIMAYVVGVMLLVVFATIPFGSIESVVGPIHGALYIIYLLTVLEVMIRARLKLWTLVAMVVSGWFPFVAFVTERYVTKRVRADLDATG